VDFIRRYQKTILTAVLFLPVSALIVGFGVWAVLAGMQFTKAHQ
jgi:hypothetical protein